MFGPFHREGVQPNHSSFDEVAPHCPGAQPHASAASSSAAASAAGVSPLNRTAAVSSRPALLSCPDSSPPRALAVMRVERHRPEGGAGGVWTALAAAAGARVNHLVGQKAQPVAATTAPVPVGQHEVVHKPGDAPVSARSEGHPLGLGAQREVGHNHLRLAPLSHVGFCGVVEAAGPGGGPGVLVCQGGLYVPKHVQPEGGAHVRHELKRLRVAAQPGGAGRTVGHDDSQGRDALHVEVDVRAAVRVQDKIAARIHALDGRLHGAPPAIVGGIACADELLHRAVVPEDVLEVAVHLRAVRRETNVLLGQHRAVGVHLVEQPWEGEAGRSTGGRSRARNARRPPRQGARSVEGGSAPYTAVQSKRVQQHQ